MMASQPTFCAYKSTSVVGLEALLVSCAYVAPRRTTCMLFLRFCCNCETIVSLDVRRTAHGARVGHPSFGGVCPAAAYGLTFS